MDARDFSGFMNRNMGVTVHNDDVPQGTTKVFSGVGDKLELG